MSESTCEFTSSGTKNSLIKTANNNHYIRLQNLMCGDSDNITLVNNLYLNVKQSGTYKLVVKLHGFDRKVKLVNISTQSNLNTSDDGKITFSGTLAANTKLALQVANGLNTCNKLKVKGTISSRGNGSLCPRDCCKDRGSVGIIYAQNIPTSLPQPTIDVINRVAGSSLAPCINNVALLGYTQPPIPDEYDEAVVQSVIDEIDERVETFLSRGIRIIIIQGSSTFIGPWILGDASQTPDPTFPNTIQIRFPRAIFIGINLGTNASRTALITNFYKTTDTFNYADLTQRTFTEVFGAAGSGLYLPLYEAGQAVAISFTSDFNAVATSAGLTVYNPDGNTPAGFQLEFDGTNFTNLNEAVAYINAAIAANPGLSPVVVGIALGGVPGGADAFTAQFPWDSVPAQVSFLGVNYAPSSTPAPRNIVLGLVATGSLFQPGNPPALYELIPTLPSILPADTLGNVLQYVEAIGLANGFLQGEGFKGYDGLSRYDAFHYYIFQWIANLFIPAGSVLIATDPSFLPQENPRWTAAKTTSFIYYK